MKKNIGLLVLLMVLTFFCCGNGDDPDVTIESKFIGAWLQNDSEFIHTFSDGIFTIQLNELYRLKGTWSIENPNKLIINYTHGNDGTDRENINDLIEFVIQPVGVEYTFEYLSEKNMKWVNNNNGNELYFTFIKK